MAPAGQPAHGPIDTRDPYQLDRLAEELVSREDNGKAKSALDDADIPLAELPDYGPLSHHNKLLTGSDFNVEEFLLSRSSASLPELRVELRDYLATLKEELVQLINNDYEAFISLSTDLRSDGSKLKKMRGPLGDLRRRVLESRGELQTIQNAIQDKLDKRAVLREEKAVLHLLLKISESVTRLESLLLIVSPGEGDDFIGISASGIPGSNTHDELYEDRGRSNRAKHIARVASEYMQLLYHVSKAREEKCAFVDELQWRIDRIQSTLSSDLDHLFATLSGSIRDIKLDGRLSEIERAKWLTDLRECLRTYDVLGLWRDAEDVLKREIVRPFVRKTVYRNALDAPHSPVVPKTPFHLGPIELIPSTGTFLRTPYTPFTAFVPKQDSPFSATSHLTGPPMALPEDQDNPLAHVYNQLLRFVARDVKDIMEVAEKVSRKKRVKDQGVADNSSLQEGDTEGFQILARVVWEEVAEAIINDIGDAVFASGRPDNLRKNYDTTQNFLRCLELCAPSAQAIYAMRSHELYQEFERRWQLPVYFQLRWKEIVTNVEEALNELHIEPSTTKDKSAFVLPQSIALWKGVTMCWSPEILIPELSHRFWRLSLQLLSRYTVWVTSAYTSIEESTSASRSTTSPGPSNESPSVEAVAADEALLRQYAAIVGDIKLLDSKIETLWRQEISIILPPETLESMDDQGLRDVLRHVRSKLESVIQPASAQIIAILTKRCCEALLPVRSIPSQFRAMSSKRLPTEPSYFVQTVFRPLKAFFAIGSSDGPGRSLKDAYSLQYSQEVFNNVAQRYISYLAAMKKTEESLRRLKRGKKATFSLFGNAKDDDGHDEERIRTQMLLDVEAFGKEAKSLGVDLTNSEHYAALKDIVITSDQDDLS